MVHHPVPLALLRGEKSGRSDEMSDASGFAGMTGVRPQHLQRRAGTYYLRVRVPPDLKALVGMCEVRRTLGVHTLSKARPLALKFASRVLETFAMLQNQEFSKDEARRLVIACFRELETNLEHGFVPETDDPEYELAEQVAAWSEVNCTVRSQLQNKAFDQPVIGMAKSLVGRNGHSWKELPAANRQDMLVGVSQALLEAHRLFLFRLESQLQPYHPANELFAESRDAPIAEAFPPAASKVGMPVGPSVKVVVEHFLQSMKSGWTPKTYRSRQTRLNYLIEFLGPDRILSTVNAADLREYSEGLLKFRNRNTCHVGKTFSEKQTNNPEHRISPYTANLIFITTKVFFAWAKSKKGYIEHNPASDLTIDVPKKAKKALKVRRPFSPEELKVLFSAPLFTGCLAVHRRFQPGKHIIKDDKYWIPLVGFFTGMRLGEIVQLHVDDVILDGAIARSALQKAIRRGEGGGRLSNRRRVGRRTASPAGSRCLCRLRGHRQ